MREPSAAEQARADRIAEMRERGKTYEQISRAMGISASNISWICLKYGIEGPRLAKLGDKGPAVVMRGNHVVRRFTTEDDATITAMELAGARREDIARALGRKSNSILGRQMTLARRAERALELSAPTSTKQLTNSKRAAPAVHVTEGPITQASCELTHPVTQLSNSQPEG